MISADLNSLYNLESSGIDHRHMETRMQAECDLALSGVIKQVNWNYPDSLVPDSGRGPSAAILIMRIYPKNSWVSQPIITGNCGFTSPLNPNEVAHEVKMRIAALM